MRQAFARRYLPLAVAAASIAGCTPATFWSPDGQRLAVLAYRGLQVFDRRTSRFTRVERGRENRLQVADAAWSPEGARLAYMVGSSDGDTWEAQTLRLWDAAGGGARQLAKVGPYRSRQMANSNDDRVGTSSLSWRPDGKEIAYTAPASPATAGMEAAPFSVWVVGVAGGAPRRLSLPDTTAGYPSWSPNGRWIAYAGAQPECPQVANCIWVIRPDGSDRRLLWSARRGLAASVGYVGLHWSQDSRRLGTFVFRAEEPGGGGPTEAWVLSLAGGAARRIASLPDSQGAVFSPALDELWTVSEREPDGPPWACRIPAGGRPQFLYRLFTGVADRGDRRVPAFSPDRKAVSVLDGDADETQWLVLQTLAGVREYRIPH